MPKDAARRDLQNCLKEEYTLVVDSEDRQSMWRFNPLEFQVFGMVALVLFAIAFIARQPTFVVGGSVLLGMTAATFAREQRLRGSLYFGVALILAIVAQIAPAQRLGVDRWQTTAVAVSVAVWGLTRFGWDKQVGGADSATKKLAGNLAVAGLSLWAAVGLILGTSVLYSALGLVILSACLKLVDLAENVHLGRMLIALAAVGIVLIARDHPDTAIAFGGWFVSGPRLSLLISTLPLVVLGFVARRRDHSAGLFVWFSAGVLYALSLLVMAIFKF